MPFRHTYRGYSVNQLCMPKLCIGKGRQVIKSSHTAMYIVRLVHELYERNAHGVLLLRTLVHVELGVCPMP